jgi:hypothetical protein
MNCPEQRGLDRVDTSFSLSSKLQVVFRRGNYLCPLFPDCSMSSDVSPRHVAVQIFFALETLFISLCENVRDEILSSFCCLRVAGHSYS